MDDRVRLENKHLRAIVQAVNKLCNAELDSEFDTSPTGYSKALSVIIGIEKITRIIPTEDEIDETPWIRSEDAEKYSPRG